MEQTVVSIEGGMSSYRRCRGTEKNKRLITRRSLRVPCAYIVSTLTRYKVVNFQKCNYVPWREKKLEGKKHGAKTCFKKGGNEQELEV